MTTPSTPFTLHLCTLSNSSETLPQVLKLIHGLALYEKAPESVFATLDLLKLNFFGGGENGEKGGRYAECMLAYVGGGPGVGEAVGFACYFYTFSTWTGKGGIYLEDLYVEEPMRGKGIGKALFRHLGLLCQEKDLARLDWVVLDWNESAKVVYRKMGAKPKPEWEGMRLEGEALKALAV